MLPETKTAIILNNTQNAKRLKAYLAQMLDTEQIVKMEEIVDKVLLGDA